MMKVVIIDDVRVRRDGIVALLRTYPRFAEVFAASPEEALDAAVLDTCPEVVLLSVASQHTRSLLAALRAGTPDTRVIALGVADDSAEATACLERGFAGYLPGESSLEDLCTVIEAAVRDELICPPRVAFALLQRVHELRGGWETGRGAPHLTERERDVLELLDLGLSNKEIARRLSIRALTVKNHVHNILKKTGARSRGEAAARQRRLLLDGASADESESRRCSDAPPTISSCALFWT
jgi:two-component system, NarL family, nitrate/nitrite response regulator NarL